MYIPLEYPLLNVWFWHPLLTYLSAAMHNYHMWWRIFFMFKLKHTVTYIGIWRKNHHSTDQNYTKQFSGLFTVFRLVIFIYEIFLEFLNLFWLIPKTKNIASTNLLLFWRPCISNVYQIRISLQKVAIYLLALALALHIILSSYPISLKTNDER